ncbi:MAG: hypothetical protein M3680_15020, partial [Myxococcota bacterium]|nr:hypothetical protein [Myxococcota bacterium]
MSALVELGVAAKSAVTTLGMMAAQGTVLAALALALVLVRGGRLRPAWQAAIWLVVLAKFVLPWGPAMPWSLSDLISSLRHDEGGVALALVPTVSGPVAEAPLAPAIGWLVLATIWALGTMIVLGRTLAAQRRAVHDARRAVPAPASAQHLLAM